MGALMGRSHLGHAISAALLLGRPENSGKEHWEKKKEERNTGLSTHEAWFVTLALP